MSEPTDRTQGSDPIKILIAGIGGVGGYFGGLLAKEYAHRPEVDIYFMARGAHLEHIRKNGLEVVSDQDPFIARPKSAGDEPEAFGTMDHVIICSKTYDLESICEQLRPCIHKHTLILPLLNGVNNTELVQALYPDNTVLMGCVYLLSKLTGPGKIEQSGSLHSLYFGLDNYQDLRSESLYAILKQAQIEANYSTDISAVVWEKFIFLSAIATATSYFDSPIGAIMEDPEKKELLKELVAEATQIARVKKVEVHSDILEKTMGKFESLPAHITSSMHRDFQDKKSQTELASLTGYIVREGETYSCSTPRFAEMYDSLKEIELGISNEKLKDPG